MKATIWHNPRCSKSRETLALLEAAGAEITIVDYLKEPPSRATLARLLEKAGLTPAQGARAKDVAAAGLTGLDQAALLDAMVADPGLIERPFVETAKGVRIGRPPERVREIL